MEGFIGSKEHAHVECTPNAEGQLDSPGVICLLLVFHREWDMGKGLHGEVGRRERMLLLVKETVTELRGRCSR